MLPNYWSLHLYEYQGQIWIGEKPFEIYPGYVTLLPPTNTPYRYLISGPALDYYVHFTLPAPPSSHSSRIPVVQDIRGALYHFEQGVIALGRAFFYDNNRPRAEVKLWDLLWELEAYGRRIVAHRHPCIDKILALIDAKLSEDISVTCLAREVGLSRTHLARIFQQDKGVTILAYVRQQRAQRAKYLLEHTTLSVSNIAVEVGSPNLQSFSKLLRKETGHSPSHWRRQVHLL
ncbi:Helix-turn-helix domain-containing protein [Abditibacterium utsteinense]|uniref:Helix-turn-helix domain-containing protein n=1 Tax=Abditibacterium utsteinense TaxID=1960156 RepID=A0A2S8SPC9_9BACT|nr:AraC family transcriptional regulator [Abditibacterium utsteinense]PQV62653.1 Helix-turn-helix domain-containing protein [Abditibacterium utsteinense]